MRLHGLIAAAAVGTPVVPFAPLKLAGPAGRLGQPVVPLSAPPVRLAEQPLAAAGLPTSAAAVRREVLAAGGPRRLLSPNLEADSGAADGLALRPLEWIP
jgi:hypothetical protein